MIYKNTVSENKYKATRQKSIQEQNKGSPAPNYVHNNHADPQAREFHITRTTSELIFVYEFTIS